jgi:hypothetical protein
MAKDKQKVNPLRTGFHVQFNLLGLVVFTVSLVAATGVLSYALGRPLNKTANPPLSGGASNEAKAPADVPAWGEFTSYDIELERPEEYVAFEIDYREKTPSWIFDRANPEHVREILLKCGLSNQQVEQVLLPARVTTTASNTVIQPGEDLIVSLSPTVRANLYAELGKNVSNHYMRFPFCLPGSSANEVLNGCGVDQEIVSLVRSLIYRRGDAQYFSDFQFVMNRIPTDEERLRLVKALSRQSVVMVRLRIRPTTDVDKLMGYWGRAPGVRLINVRPLLESMKRLQDGGSVGVGFLLPQFARERLYTYPLPSQPGDPVMDCHWSTMNFFNDVPDNRFANPSYTVQYLTSHYYQVAKPTRYGDLVFLLDDSGNAIHSGVYLADDILFTKNGNNYMEPWMLMRLKNMLAAYSAGGTPHVVVYRDRNS